MLQTCTVVQYYWTKYWTVETIHYINEHPIMRATRTCREYHKRKVKSVPEYFGRRESIHFPPAPFHVDENVTTVPPLDNSQTHSPTGQTIETIRASVHSPNQPGPGAMRDTVNMGITTPLLTPEPPTTTPPLFSTSLPASVAPRTAQTSWHLPVHLTSHLRLILV